MMHLKNEISKTEDVTSTGKVQEVKIKMEGVQYKVPVTISTKTPLKSTARQPRKRTSPEYTIVPWRINGSYINNMFIFFMVCVTLVTGSAIYSALMSPYMKLTSDLVKLSYPKNTGIHWPPPPPPAEYAKVARYIAHISNWGSLATISTHSPIKGYPFNNVFSVSDGVVKKGTGIPYFYLSELEISVADIEADNRATLSLSEAQSGYCQGKALDPEDPRCAHVMLTGNLLKINNHTTEADFAEIALFTRHPEMEGWPESHNWFFAKLNITHIYLLDHFGGAQVIPPQEYFAVNDHTKPLDKKY